MNESVIRCKAPLAPGIFKYSHDPLRDRVPVFLKKILNGEQFIIKTKQGLTTVVFDRMQYQEIENHFHTKNRKFYLKTIEGATVPFGAIVKTPEFGGEPPGSRESLEQIQIDQISRQLAEAKNGSKWIDLQVGNEQVRAAAAVKTADLCYGKAPKSDMSILDHNGNPVAWVSLKGHKFRWGGWSKLANEPEISYWLGGVKKETQGVLAPRQSFGFHINDDTKCKIVYGPGFKTSALSISNVNSVLIGTPSITKVKNSYSLSATMEYKNGVVPTGLHEPYLVVRYMLGRPDVGLNNARAETNTVGEPRNVKFLNK